MNNGTSKVYKFTKNDKFLNEQERDFYEENGFLVKKNLLDHQILDECTQRFTDIAENKVPKGKWMAIMKNEYLKTKNVQGEHLVDKIQFISYDDVFYKYISFGPMIDVIDSIIGPNISTFQSMFINKPPDSGADTSLHPVHQDLYYLPMKPENSLVASWTAMENVDENNRCLYVYPGTHKTELYTHEYGRNETRYLYLEIFENKKLLNGISKVYLPMEKGDTVFFHPLLFHGSGPNLTKRFRKAISSHYIDSISADFVEVQGTIRENITNKIVGFFKKFGHPTDYRGELNLVWYWLFPVLLSSYFQNFWRLKTRFIRGEPGIFQHSFYLNKL